METEILLLWLLVVLLVGVGFAGTIVPAVPGVPLIFAGLWLAAAMDDYARVGGLTVAVLGVLSLLALLVDFVATVLGAQRVGASRQALIGAMLGTFAGLFFGLPGLLIGPFIGAVAGELSARGGWEQAAKVGLGTWLGLVFGTLAKLTLSLAMLGIFVLAYFL